MKHDRASRPSAPVARWAGSSRAPLARTLDANLRSAASNASATTASRIGTAHNLIRFRPRNPTQTMLCNPVDHIALRPLRRDGAGIWVSALHTRSRCSYGEWVADGDGAGDEG